MDNREEGLPPRRSYAAINNTERIIIGMSNELKIVSRDVTEIKDSIREDYVTKALMENENLRLRQEIKHVSDRVELPIKLIYGFVALVLVAFVGALIVLVIPRA